METRRAEVRANVFRDPVCYGRAVWWTGGHALGQLAYPAAAQLGARTATGKLAIEEHGHLKLKADAIGDHQRLGAGRSSTPLVEIHDRCHVECPHARVLPAVGGPHHVHALDRCARATQHRLRDVRAGRREREHRAVVIGVRVNVQQAHPRRAADARCARRWRALIRAVEPDERSPDRRDRPRVAALGNVGHGEQQW